MTSFFPNPSSVFGKLRLNVYVDASFSSGGSRSRSGMAMYLVDTTDGSESIIQWASRRQTSMATSAPEAEVTAMAEGFATAIFLFDSLKEIQVITGFGPDCILSMKTDSAVALKQMNNTDKNCCPETCLSSGAHISGSSDSAHLYPRTISES